MRLLSLGSLCVSSFLQVHSIYALRIKEDKPQDVRAPLTLLLSLEVPKESEVRADKHIQVHHMIMGVGDGAQHENTLKTCLQHLFGM
ncbi:hypothetical protein MUK42_36442 [Musa troglodytarum]|uniref:Secreted protein n=1 Tax=Musa troglodytarum TaxID=320322 RepID=A0A9E7E8U3_9LILI|nr:hypothetical protein MUK42_36442 [Musa troglodytarum]